MSALATIQAPTTPATKAGVSAELAEQVLIKGDLKELTPSQRVEYYVQVCTSLGVNPLTKPFEYISLNGKLTLYAKKDAADQLRKVNRVNIDALHKEFANGLYIVTAAASTPDGRKDTSVGAVSVEGLKGDALANAIMKTETKAKRRVTLSICGLGFLDETEVASIPDARLTTVSETGEILQPLPVQAWQPSEMDMALIAQGNADCAEMRALTTDPKILTALEWWENNKLSLAQKNHGNLAKNVAKIREQLDGLRAAQAEPAESPAVSGPAPAAFTDADVSAWWETVSSVFGALSPQGAMFQTARRAEDFGRMEELAQLANEKRHAMLK